jgi:hypothetical protein
MKRNGDASKAFARKERWFGEFSFSNCPFKRTLGKSLLVDR